MDDLLERFHRSIGRRPLLRGESEQESMTLADWAPSVDISETDSEYRIQVELPGVDKKGVKVSVHEGVLEISGERKTEREEKTEKLHRVERAYGRFARSFVLPENVDENGVSAKYKDGVLDVRVQKAEEAKPRSIEVKVA
jgi:HSP20 family protein